MLIVDWGTIPYNQAWEQQEQLFEQTIRQKLAHQPTQNRLILCEHPHVYTLGKSGNAQNMLLTQAMLQQQHIPLIRTNRGGDITYHGPGQIVAYPIFNLEALHIGLKRYIYLLEEAIVNTLKKWDIVAERLEEATGVWIGIGTPHCRKIAAIGVRSSHYVTMHGIALNVNTDLHYFQAINPCGFTTKGVTSMQQELRQPIDIDQVKTVLVREMAAAFS